MISTLLILNFDEKVLNHSFDFPLLDHRACTSDAATMANTVQMSAVSTYDACLSFGTYIYLYSVSPHNGPEQTL